MNNAFVFLTFGVLSSVGGVFALFNPFAASLAVEIYVGALFILAAIGWFLTVFEAETLTERLWLIATSLLFGWAGWLFLSNPVEGIVSLSLMLGLTSALLAGAKFGLAYALRGTSAVWPLVIAGGLSLAMSGLILGVIPMTHTPGLLFAAELLTNGAVMIALGLSVRRLQLA